MQHTSTLSRRGFLKRSMAAAAFTAAVPASLQAQTGAGPRFPIIAFSKPFQKLSASQTADLVAEVGWDGIECPVRNGGQVLPERVEEDLPRLVEALKSRGKSVSTITTGITRVDASAEKVLRVAARLGIRSYRLGAFKYARKASIPMQLDQLRPQLRELAALNKEVGITGGLQNHSGADNVGAPVWDLYLLVKDLDPKHLGVCFDIGHATIEGGYSWPIDARLMEPHFAVVYIKDFGWQKAGKAWRATWCPLGQGMVSTDFIKWLKQSSYHGPISQHHEYPGSEGSEAVPYYKEDLKVLKSWLS